jgi:tetratricopeptide (TPR) repeat protein
VVIGVASLLGLVAVAAPAPGASCERAPYECALAHLERGEFEAAVGLLEGEAARRPGDLRVLNLLGIALTGAGRVEAANRRFEAALERDPGFDAARRNLAINRFDAGRLDEARRGFEAILGRAPQDEVAHVYLAEIRFAAGESAEAVAHYERSGDRPLQSPLSTLHYGTALLAEGRVARAAEVFDRLPERDAEGRFQAGRALGEAGAHREAARLFASARPNHPDPAAAGYNEVLMRLEAGDPESAVRAAGELAEAGLQSAELLNLVSRAHLQAGRVVEAYDALREATRLDPLAEENYFDLVSICLDHENHDLALEIVDIGLRTLPDSLGLHLQRAVLLAEQGSLPAAEAAFEAARRLAPESAAPLVGLAMTWMQAGQTERAVEALRGAAAADAEAAMLPYVFGLALVRSGVEASGPGGVEAMAAFETALERDPEFAPALAELGKLQLKGGEAAAAVETLERALELDPDAAPTAYMLARAYQAAGQREQARSLLARSDRLRSGGDEAATGAEMRRAMFRIVREGSPAPKQKPD